MDPQISRAQDQHLQAVCEMVRTANEKDVQRDYPPQWLSSADENLKAAIDAQHLRVVTVDNEIAACFSIDTSDELLWGRSLDTAWYLHCLTVATQFQGRGLGRYAVQYVESAAAASGMQFVRLDVPTVREVTRSWYRSMGYRECGVVQPPTYRRPAMLYEKHLLEAGQS